LYESTGQFSKSESLYEQAVNIIKETLGEDHPDYGTTVNNLALLYVKTGEFQQAESLFKRDLEIIKKSLGASHPNYSYALSNLAGLYENIGKYSDAEKLYKEAIAIRKNAFGEKHPEYATVINNLARVYTATGKLQEAENLWYECIKNYLYQINAYFPSLSEREKEEFYLTISPKFEQFNSFSILRKKENSSILSTMYNNQLATKALLLNSSNKVKQRILNSGDEKLIRSFKEWQHQKELLARYYSQTTEERNVKKINIDSLEAKANELEKELSLKSELFKGNNEKQQYKWQDVQKKLKEGEAAVEIIRFRKYKADSAGIYSTNVVYYAALIIKPGTSGNPECVLMENGEDLEGKFMKYYRNSIKFKIQDDHAYNQYWRRIKEVLGDVKKVYISPDGVFNQINLYSIKNPDTKKYIIDETEIQIVTNTKDLIETVSAKYQDKKIILIGDPAFNPDGTGNSSLAPLPGTNTEVKKINEMLSKNNWTGDVYTGRSATEEKLKKVRDPRVLHIATHGFFDQDTDIEKDDKNKNFKNPLLKSGLMLAGAGISSYGSEATEDGILTSFEAMNMDLDNTDLVVLSACETGLGEIRNGEGVYGLQRAFRVAGARSILISLWKVNDETTQKLMVYFYDEWVKTGDKRASFRAAQEKIRKEFPDPYYWGAFVLIGE
jgi:CHAT domain-containing protein/Tfp pilus assembly protein PilF